MAIFLTLLCTVCPATSSAVAGPSSDGNGVASSRAQYALPATTAAVNPPAASGVAARIAAIEIVIAGVFDDSAAAVAARAYEFLDKVHVRTRSQVVRRELLFAVGEPLDLDLLAQTERNLRALPFLREARVEALPTGELDDEGNPLVRVRVTTWDTWSTTPDLRIAKVGDRFLWSAGLSETNFLGRGKEFEVSLRNELDRSERWLSFRDPQLLGSRFVLGASYSDRSDGSSARLSLQRPFFSPDDTWSGGVRVEAFDGVDYLYEDGKVARGLRHVRRWADFELSRALSHDSRHAWRVDLAYRSREDRVAGELRDFGILEAGISSIENRFLELDHVSRFERTEDFNLGRQLGASVGISAPWLGGEDGTSYFVSLFHKQGLLLGREHFVTGTVRWDARHRRGRWENGLGQLRLAWLRKQARRHVTLATAELRYGVLLDPERQLAVGAESGLRGYPVRRWVGTRSLLLSAEQRWFVVDDLGQLLSLGLAAFVDSGAAWPESQSLALGDLCTDLGVGILLGRNRLAGSQSTVRFDLAYALDPVDGRSRWLFTSGSRIEF